MKYFITFGNNNFTHQTRRLKKQAEQSQWFDKIIIENQDTINGFYSVHKNFIENNDRGYGYWIWKPYIILKLLYSISCNDYIFYTDAGASIVNHKQNRLIDYINMLDNSEKPLLTFSTEYPEKHFQKQSTLQYFNNHNLSSDINFLNSNQVESGVLICKKTSFVLGFIQEWLRLCLTENYRLVVDADKDEAQSSDFIEHRHDQSLLSILCKLHNTTIICCNEAYGNGPFFSSRLTDDLPRQFAPDLFRMDSRYKPDIHLTWLEWLKDYPDSRFNYDILLQNLQH